MKKIFLTVMCVAMLLISFVGAFSVMPIASAESTTVVTFAKDNFRNIGIGESAAIKIVGISASGDKTHGAIPADEWGSPVKIANESYLIYQVGDGADNLTKLYMTLNAQLWNQDNDIAHAENAIKVYVGSSVDGDMQLVSEYTFADASNKLIDDTLNLSENATGKSKVYVKVEVVQSKTDCGSESCSNGSHKCGNTVATPDGYIDIWHFGIKLYEIAFLSDEPSVDKEQPIPNDFKSLLPAEVNVSKAYAFPEIVFTDNVDGVVDYYITMTDPYNVSTELGANAKEFFPEYEGIYVFEIWAQDAMGNKYTDKFSLTCVLPNGAPVIYHENIPEKNGRLGVKYVIEPLCYDESEVDTLDIYALDPDGKRIEINDGGFVPEKVGEYRVMYTATNEVGTSKLMARVYVKYNIGDGNAVEMVQDAANWQGSAKASDNGVYISGLAYSPIPLSIEEGINLTITLPTQAESWVGIYFTRTAGYGLYYFEKETYSIANAAPGLYILIYKQTSGYYCNIDYVGLTRSAMEVVNHFSCGTGPDVNIAFVKGSDDTIEFYVNGTKNENYELNYSVKASVCADNEMFTYLGFGNITKDGVTVKGVDICDNEPPQVSLSNDFPDKLDLGSVLKMPVISANDSHDGEVECVVKLYSPDGKTVSLSDGSVTLSQEGVWYCLVNAQDFSGNRSYVIYEINVGNTDKTTYFDYPDNSIAGWQIALIAVGSLCVVAGAVTAGLFLFKKKRKDSGENV